MGLSTKLLNNKQFNLIPLESILAEMVVRWNSVFPCNFVIMMLIVLGLTGVLIYQIRDN